MPIGEIEASRANFNSDSNRATHGLRTILPTALRLLRHQRGRTPRYGAAARQLGELLAAEDIELVYGGASVGIMGELADAVHEHGGHVTGIIPQQLIQKEEAHRGIPDLIVVGVDAPAEVPDGRPLATASSRCPAGSARWRASSSSSPGGSSASIRKPSGILNVAGYFDSLIGFLDHAVEEGFLLPRHRDSIMVESDPLTLLDRMRAFAPADGERLMGRTNR